MQPAIDGGNASPSGSAASSSASRKSKIRSAEATPDWSTVTIDAIWVIGWENCREYWMKACTAPSVSTPAATRRPPTTAMATNVRFPMTIIDGMIDPEMNDAPKLASNSASLVARKRASTSPWRPKALTMLWPVNDSSTRALSAPVWRH